jgi:Holliday junction resolvase RusA-like endonuclease
MSRRRRWTDPPRKDRAVLAGIDPRLKQRAYDRLSILREWHRRSSNPGKLKTKTEVTRKFLADFNAGMLWPEGALKFISHVSKSSIHGWNRLYRSGGIRALLSRYKYKGDPSTQRPVFRPAARPFEMKFAGPPRTKGKAAFTERIKRRWKWPPSEFPVRLAIYYSMPIPMKIKMGRRMKYFRSEISHTKRPNLDALNAFIVDCLTGIVFKSHSQIVQLHSEKQWAWWPQVRILIRELRG